MTERAEKKSDDSFWLILVGVITHNVLTRVLGLWLSEPLAQGAAAWVVVLVGYRFLAGGKATFKAWAVGTLLFIAGYTSITYGLSHLLCPALGPARTWGIVGFALVGFAALFVTKLYRILAGTKAWHWLLPAAALAATFALFAHWNPEGFCGGL